MHKVFHRSFSKLIIKEPQVLIANGMRLVASAVQTTLGPSGRNVAIDSFSPELHTSTHGLHSDAKPLVTKDGVTVATNMRRLQTNNQLTRLGVQLMIDASERTNEESGDGTTTTCVIASAIISEARRIQSDPIKVRRGLKLGVKAICEQLDTMAIQVKNESDVRNLALISSNNDKGIADVLARVYSEVGLNGAISIQDGDGTHRETTVEFVSGLQIDCGFLSPYFADNQPLLEFADREVYVAIIDGSVDSQQDVVRLLEFAKKTQAPMIVFAHEFQSDALTALVVNKLQLGLRIAAVKAPIFQAQEILEDLAAFSGGQVMGDRQNVYREFELHKTDPVHVLGKVKSAKLTAEKTILRGLDSQNVTKNVEERINWLEHQLEDEMVGEHDSDLIKERIGKLQGGLCIVRAGGYSQVEVQETRDRLEDALSAVQAALEQGYVVGGGFALLKASQNLPVSDDPHIALGLEILKNAVSQPAKQILRNQGIIPEPKIEQYLQQSDPWLGYDGKTRQLIDFRKAGIIDPVKVVKNSMIYASGVAGLVATATDVAIVNERIQRVRMHEEIQV